MRRRRSAVLLAIVGGLVVAGSVSIAVKIARDRRVVRLEHPTDVIALAFAPGTDDLVTVSMDAEQRWAVWDLAGETPRHSEKLESNALDVAVSCSGLVAMAHDGGDVSLGSPPMTLICTAPRSARLVSKRHGAHRARQARCAP